MTITYKNEFHDTYAERTVASASRIAPMLMKVTPVNSVVDVGCGHGYWLKAFMDQGVNDVVGMDGSYIDRSSLAIPDSAFVDTDLQKPPKPDRTFDLSVCLEVAEHLPARCTGAFMDFVTALAPVSLFSAAIPGQPGNDHINARWHGFWNEEFKKRGFACFDFVRPAIWQSEEIFIHYRQNIFVYAREDVLRDPRFADLAAQPRRNCLTLVDEDTLLQNIGLRALIRSAIKRVKDSRR